MDAKRTIAYVICSMVFFQVCLVANVTPSTDVNSTSTNDSTPTNDSTSTNVATTTTVKSTSTQTSSSSATTTGPPSTTPTTKLTTITSDESTGSFNNLTPTSTWISSPSINMSSNPPVASPRSFTFIGTITRQDTLATSVDYSESTLKTNTENSSSAMASMITPVSSLPAQTGTVASEMSSIISSTGISKEPLTQGTVLQSDHQECLNTVSDLRQDRAVILGVLLAMCVMLFLLLMAACRRIKRLGESVITIHKKYDINNSKEL